MVDPYKFEEWCEGQGGEFEVQNNIDGQVSVCKFAQGTKIKHSQNPNITNRVQINAEHNGTPESFTGYKMKIEEYGPIVVDGEVPLVVEPMESMGVDSPTLSAQKL